MMVTVFKYCFYFSIDIVILLIITIAKERDINGISKRNAISLGAYKPLTTTIPLRFWLLSAFYMRHIYRQTQLVAVRSLIRYLSIFAAIFMMKVMMHSQVRARLDSDKLVTVAMQSR